MSKWIKASHRVFYWETLAGIGLLALGILIIRVYLRVL